MSKFGFDDDADLDTVISLPRPAANKPKKSSKRAVEQAGEAGKQLGFVSREGQGARRPGRRQTEPQGRILLTGPERILERFRRYCEINDSRAYWMGLETLLDESDNN